MTKRIIALAVLLVSLLALAGCDSDFSFLASKDCDHEWVDADCSNPKTCEECGKTRGKALGHDWVDATCSDPKTCKNCGKTKGKALGHQWTPASCSDPAVCMTCGETGETSGHVWQDATCYSPMTCMVCGETEGDVLDHNWISDSASNTQYCTMCGLEASVTPEVAPSEGILADVSVGDTVKLGYYGGQDIEWIVLDYDPASNQALLISKYCLDAIPYHAGSDTGTWENCTLRKWLNNSFMTQAFSAEEQAAIVYSYLTNDDNPDFDVEGGNDTVDQIFLLSYEEAVYYFPSQASRKCKPTAYCLEQGCYDPVKYAEEHGETCDPEAVGYTWWWLRTPGVDADHACNVVAKGTASSYGGMQTSGQGGVRPAMWIQLG